MAMKTSAGSRLIEASALQRARRDARDEVRRASMPRSCCQECYPLYSGRIKDKLTTDGVLRKGKNDHQVGFRGMYDSTHLAVGIWH